ncbi:hypothetical protein ACOCG1_003338 [Vibrio cholerae]
MASTIHHVHIPVESLLAMNDQELSETVTHPDGMEAAKKELKEMLDEGVTCLVLDSSCDSKNTNGSCAGHPVDDSSEKSRESTLSDKSLDICHIKALKEVTSALRELRRGDDRAVVSDGEVLGYWQTPEYIEYLLELADKCDRSLEKYAKPMFSEPRKHGRCDILDKYGDLICRCESEYARDSIFSLMMQNKN